MTTYRMTVRNAPPGVLLLRDGVALFKTEYAKSNGDPEVFVLASGECYCGDGYDVDCIDVTADVVDEVRSQWEAP